VIGIRSSFGEEELVRRSFHDDIDLGHFLPPGFVSNQRYYYQHDLLDPNDMEYVIQDIVPGSAISISLPYVPYERFKGSQGYRHGLSYADYVKALELMLFEPWAKHDKILEFKRRMCKVEMQHNERRQFPCLEVTAAQVSRRTMPRYFQAHEFEFRILERSSVSAWG